MNFRQHCEQAKAKSARYMWVVLALFPLHLAHSWFSWTVFTYPFFQSQYWSLVIILPIIMVMVIRRFYLKLSDREAISQIAFAFQYRWGFCKNCGKQRFERVRTKHVRHLALAFLTFGVWVLGWIAKAFWNAIRRWQCTECGAKKCFGIKQGIEQTAQRLVSPTGQDPAENRLFNVVEEMAIATGLPVPKVRLIESIEEDRWQPINACAAGSKPENATIGVCREALGKLTRPELQGMLAHVFGQMLNGDLRLNNWLKALMIKSVFLKWYVLAPFLFYASGSLIDLLSNAVSELPVLQDFKPHLMLKLVATMVMFFLLLVIANLPTSITRAARNAMSRERKFLADATAVRLVLNPSAVANALKKMSRESHAMTLHAKGSISTAGVDPAGELALQALERFLERFALGIKGSGALDREVAHSFFGNLQAESSPSHPTTEERIHRIEPDWDGDLGEVESTELEESPKTSTSKARSLLDSLPALIIHQARDAFDARCVLYALLMDKDEHLRNKQLQTIRSDCDNATAETTEAISPLLAPLSPVQKMALVDLALPVLAELSLEQYRAFRRMTKTLIEADGRIDLFEWSLRQVLDYRLHSKFGKDDTNVRGNSTVEDLQAECILVIAGIAHFGQGDAPAEPPFRTGLAAMKLDASVDLPAPERCGVMQIAKAVEKLKLLSDSARKVFLEGCSRAVEHDKETSDVEYQILRGVTAALSCPLPPILGSVAT